MTEKRIQSYIYHGDKCFFVSTLGRTSTGRQGYGTKYNETIVWEWCSIMKERGEMLQITEGYAGSISNHFEVCEKLYYRGEPNVL